MVLPVPISPVKGPISRIPVIFRARLHYGSPLFGYVLSFALTLVAGILRMALVERNFFLFPFVFFYPAIGLASFLGGAGPGLASALLGAVFAFMFFPDPPAPQNWIALAIIAPLLAAGFAHLRHIRDRNRAIARELINFKLIGDHASDWILLIGESGRILYVNLKAATDLGWTDRELTGRAIESLVPDNQRSLLGATLERAKSGNGKPVELTFERRDRSLALMELGCTAVRTGDEQVIHAAARDIGERKRFEKNLREIRHWESLGALAGGLAHDFNNLLTSILGNASLVRSILPPGHETARMLDGIIVSAEQSSDLVRMLLATSGHRSRHTEALLLDQLLERTLATRRLPPRIRVATEAVVAPFRGDRHAFETLLWSLISNAAEAYGEQEGEIRVVIGSGQVPIPKRAARTSSFEEGDSGKGECLGIVVEDSGSGMSPEILDRAFDPFFSTKFTGRGLGLPAVRGIVRAYSGKLLVETAVGQGTRVEVWLPKS
jgi:PAS domain S-box-containing protein